MVYGACLSLRFDISHQHEQQHLNVVFASNYSLEKIVYCVIKIGLSIILIKLWLRVIVMIVKITRKMKIV